MEILVQTNKVTAEQIGENLFNVLYLGEIKHPGLDKDGVIRALAWYLMGEETNKEQNDTRR